MTIFLINMTYIKLLLKNELGLASRIDFVIFVFMAKVTLRNMDTRLRLEYASAQLYARCPEEGNLSSLTVF